MANAEKNKTRSYVPVTPGMDTSMIDPLGPLAPLLGNWEGKGTGWNMIALPFKDAPDPSNVPFRILMNQYDENLNFTFVADNVPNRGIFEDQEVATLDYQQKISQIAAEDFPPSTKTGNVGDDIHHEPGLWIHVKKGEPTINDINIARLASIPHGNAVLALGSTDGEYVDGMPEILPVNGLPIGRFEDLTTPGYDFNDDPYLGPYKHYIDAPFKKDLFPGFPGFSPSNMNEILNFANQGVDIERTLVLNVDSTREDAGISNMPFVTREAEPVSLRSTFWIQELKGKDKYGKPKLRMQYSQIVMLDFFPNREDQLPGRAQWPHISINTLDKVGDYPTS